MTGVPPLPFKDCVIVCNQVGVNAEHSWADAPIIGYMMEYSCNLEHLKGYQENGHCVGYDNLKKSMPLTCPLRLSWNLSPACVERIDSALALARKQIEDLDLYLLQHNDFGKGVMKQCKISPDAFIQMALQMAYFKVRDDFIVSQSSSYLLIILLQDAGKFCLTYEASMTRLYLHGRTETVRPVTMHSSRFVRAMCDPNIKDTLTVSHDKSI